jgi:PIN domain nuclease of toxin-antitoxin system
LRLLLDTHALLWGLMSPERLPDGVRTAIRSESDRTFVSVASIWEIAIKARLGKLYAPDDLPSLIDNDPDYDVLPITPEHAWRVRRLPILHRDPFDQLLIAQALVEDLTIVTHDRAVSRYGARTIMI